RRRPRLSPSRRRAHRRGQGCRRAHQGPARGTLSRAGRDADRSGEERKRLPTGLSALSLPVGFGDNQREGIGRRARQGGHTRARRTGLSILTAIPVALAAAQSGAADLKVLGAGPVEHTFKELAPAFTQTTGHKVEGTFDTIGVIERKLKAGEKADILILTTALMDEMAKAGSLIP